MKKILLFGCIVLMGCFSKKRDNIRIEEPKAFSNCYEAIVNDFSTQSYYMSLTIFLDSRNSEKVIIQNDDLYYVLNEFNKLSRPDYIIKLLKIITTDRVLVVDSLVFDYLLKYKLNNNCNELNLNEDDLIIKYFDARKMLKKEYASDENIQTCLMYKLLNNGILMRNGDETGILKIEKKCNEFTW